MRTEQAVFEKLVTYLESHGYPPETMAVEYKLGNYRVDLAIIDPKNNMPIQLFEIKSSKSERAIDFGKDQIRKYLDYIEDKSIPTYLVFPLDVDPGFEIERIKLFEEDNKKNYIAEAQTVIQTINYSGQRNSRFAEKIIRAEEKKDNTKKLIKGICWFSAPIFAAIGLLNHLGKITLSSIDLIFLAAVFGVILLPLGAQIKILGFEIGILKKEREEI